MFCRAVKMHCMQETLHSMPACQIAESFCFAEVDVERVRYRHFRAVKQHKIFTAGALYLIVQKCNWVYNCFVC